MNFKKIALRADGNAEIGYGHIMRMVALYQMLHENFSCKFYSRFIDPSLETIVKKYKLCFVELRDSTNHEKEFLNHLDGTEIVVLDNYFFDYEFQKTIKEKGSKLVCIDDTNSNQYAADVIINHAPFVNHFSYEKEPYTRIHSGLDYALLRPIFFQKRKCNPSKGSIFICFGGSDSKNITTNIVRKIHDLPLVEKIHIVVSNNFQFLGELRKFTGSNKISINQNIGETEMIELISSSEMAIVPSSTMLYEVIALNRPVVSGYTVQNQIDIFRGFKQMKVIYPFGDFNELNTFSDYFKNLLERPHTEILKNQKTAFRSNPKVNLNKLFVELS